MYTAHLPCVEGVLEVVPVNSISWGDFSFFCHTLCSPYETYHANSEIFRLLIRSQCRIRSSIIDYPKQSRPNQIL